MKKILLPVLLFSLATMLVRAQNTDALVNAEKAFEKDCLIKGIRDGFLANVDSNAVIVVANGPVNAKKFWASLPVLEGVFSWSASYAEMSVSGDWGYTTGNYEHRAKTLADTVNDWGQYNTVWHKTDNGEWKYLIDMGTPHPPAQLEKFAKSILIEKKSAGENTREDSLINLDKRFISSFEKNMPAAYQTYGSEKYIMTLSGNAAVTSTSQAIYLISKIPSSLKFHATGVKISPAHDMAAVYGDLEKDDKRGNYMRIWRHEKNGWKIALEVIRI